jgi:hypothetical protein
MTYIVRLANYTGFTLGECLEDGVPVTSIDTHCSRDIRTYDTKELAHAAIKLHLNNVPTFLFEVYELPNYILSLHVGATKYVLQEDDSLVPTNKSTHAKRFPTVVAANTYAKNTLNLDTFTVSAIENLF